MILQGDSLDRLKDLPDNSVDLVCTDPPYGYSFMGKDWDKAVPSVELWKQCLRVLKPGAWCYVMSAPRSDVQAQMIVRLTEAGFRLDFTPIYWTYASGFPKAGNIGKLVDKRLGQRDVVETIPDRRNGKATSLEWAERDNKGTVERTQPASPEAKALDGSYAGFQPKPAVEVIIVAMKPLSEKTYVDQALANGKGISWLDDCRVPTGENLNGGTYSGERREIESTNWQNTDRKDGQGSGFRRGVGEFHQPTGRFPANLLVSDDVLNDGTVTKSGKGGMVTVKGFSKTKFTGANGIGDKNEITTYAAGGDSGSYSRYFDLDKWYERNSNGRQNEELGIVNDSRPPHETAVGRRSGELHRTTQSEYKTTTLPFLIVPKASKREKNEGLDESFTAKGTGVYDDDGYTWPLNGDGTPRNKKVEPKKNHHPTVKPLKLMSYLITLGSRPGDTVLDPFVGSGTTAVAAQQLGRIPIGIEREAEYVEIATARLAHHSPVVQLAPEVPEEAQPPVTIPDLLGEQISLL